MGKQDLPPIVYGRIRLRLLEAADLPMTRGWRNQDEVRRWFLRPEAVTADEHERWFAAYQDRQDDFVFIIEETETLKRPIGQAAIYHIDRDRARAEFGRLMIGEPSARGLGLATLATRAVVEQASRTWDLREIYLEVLEANVVAQAVYAACGFTVTSRRDALVTMQVLPANGHVARGKSGSC